MIEAHFRKNYQKLFVDPILGLNSLQNVNPLTVTCIACFLGVSTAPLLFFGYPILAFLMLLASGFLDTVDGALARKQKTTSDKGAAFDLISDRMVESAALIGLYAVAPAARALPTILMLCSMFVCISSFLVVSLFTEKASEKSFFYSPGIIERAETFVFFGAMILFPASFETLAYSFALLVFMTAFIRMYQFRRAR